RLRMLIEGVVFQSSCESSNADRPAASASTYRCSREKLGVVESISVTARMPGNPESSSTARASRWSSSRATTSRSRSIQRWSAARVTGGRETRQVDQPRLHRVMRHHIERARRLVGDRVLELVNAAFGRRADLDGLRTDGPDMLLDVSAIGHIVATLENDFVL